MKNKHETEYDDDHTVKFVVYCLDINFYYVVSLVEYSFVCYFLRIFRFLLFLFPFTTFFERDLI